MLKNVTITLSEEAALWARRRAAEENTSVSRLVGQMIERQIHNDDEYADAYWDWKKLRPMKLDAGSRLPREDANTRR